jgi:hypothetical protein
MSHRVTLVAVCVVMTFAGSVFAQQPVPSEKEAREEVARQKRQSQERVEEEERQHREWQRRDTESKVRLLRWAIENNDPETLLLMANVVADEMRQMPLSPSLFDGVQWERCRTLRCAVRG